MTLLDEIKPGESRTLEFKQELPQDARKWVKTIVAFANGALSGRSSVRNRTLARTLDKIDVIEGWGTGFKRIFSQCDEYGVARPEFLEIGDMLRVNFYRPSYTKNGDKSGDKVAINEKSSQKSLQGSSQKNKKFTENEKSSQKSSQKILELIKEDSAVTTQEMADILGVTRRAVAKQIAFMQAQNLIRRIGPDKGGHWEVIEK